jgi:hypothetical protein
MIRLCNVCHNELFLPNLWKCRYHVYWNLSYPLSILKVIFSKSNKLWLKKKLEKKMVQSTGVRNPPKLHFTKQTFDVFILVSVKWNLSFIFNMAIYMQRLVIQFIEMHCTRTHNFFLFIDQHPGNNCVRFIELFTNRNVSAIKKNNYSIFIPIVAIWLWGLRNNYLFYNLLQFLTFVLYWFPTKNIDRSWTIRQTGRIFFSVEEYTNMSYYNCCGIRPKHSNISKRVR